VTEGIEMAEWKEHFMRLLGGVKGRVVKGGRERSREGEGNEEEISKEEVRRVVKELKEGKAAGVDGIPSEMWKHGGGELEEWVTGFRNKVWKGGGWPES